MHERHGTYINRTSGGLQCLEAVHQFGPQRQNAPANQLAYHGFMSPILQFRLHKLGRACLVEIPGAKWLLH